MTGDEIALVLGTSTGGVGVHVESLVKALVVQGWTVTVCAPASTQGVFDFAAAGARVATVPIRGAGREPLAVPALRGAVREAAIVHAHGLRAGLAAVLARPRFPLARPRPPLVVTWHNAVLARGVKGAVMALGERLVARGASVNLAASRDLAERIAKLGGRDVRLVPVAPPPPAPTRSPAQVRAELGVGDRPLLVCVGRLAAQKAPEILVAAAARWADLDPTPFVVIAGDGPLEPTLAAQIRRTGAPVRLLGRRSDVADLLAAADLVVAPSRWDARPLAMQEAMHLGRPVVATDVGGVAGLAGEAAVLIPPGDVDALDRAVRSLLADSAQRAELGRRAVQVAEGWPTEQQANAAVIAVYRSLLGE